MKNIVSFKKQLVPPQEVFLSCSSCGQFLLRIICKSNTNEVTTYQAQCPYCGDKSFEQTLIGEIVIENQPGLTVTDIREYDSEDITKNVFIITKTK